MAMVGAAIEGFALGFSLILAIGSQNAFILRQGLTRTHVLPIVLFAATSDALLIGAGVAGFGVIVERFPSFPLYMMWAAAALLAVYGLQRAAAAWRGEYEIERAARVGSLATALATVAAFTWLNPHVYLDTMLLLGGSSTQFDAGGERLAYGLGAASASFVFFFALGYGAALLAPVMHSARAWRILDALIALVMALIVTGLVREALRLMAEHG